MRKIRSKEKVFHDLRIRAIEQKKTKEYEKTRKRRVENHPELRSTKYLIEKDQENNKSTKRKANFVRIQVPSDFSITSNLKKTLSFIIGLKRLKNKKRSIKTIFIQLRNIKKLDTGAVNLLLSAVGELSKENIKVWGDYPEDKSCKKFFEKSGFLDHMNKISNRKTNSAPKDKNLIIRHGRDKTENKKVGEAVKKAIETIKGEPDFFQPVYGMIMEMATNSIEHAYSRKKHWQLGLFFDKKNHKVIFTFADNGFGILSTIRRKFKHRISEVGSNEIEILQNVFEKKYGSRTQEINRNKGLPFVKNAQDKNFISKLTVITNRSFYDFESGTSEILDQNFQGTFFYWEVDINGINTWQQRIK